MNPEKKEMTLKAFGRQIIMSDGGKIGFEDSHDIEKPFLSEILTLTLVARNMKIPELLLDSLVAQHSKKSELIRSELNKYNMRGQRASVMAINQYLSSWFWRGEQGDRKSLIFQIGLKQMVECIYGEVREDDSFEKHINTLLGIGSFADLEMM